MFYRSLYMGIFNMAKRELAFSTFLKLLELNEPQKATTLRGFLRGGGFNYWRPLQMLAPDIVSGKLALGDIASRVGALAKGHQRKYNEAALDRLLKWVLGRNLQYRRAPEKVVRDFGESGLKVRIEPEVAFVMDGRHYLMHIWATNSPSLSDETLSMGLHFFRQSMKPTLPDANYLLFDTIKNRVFSEVDLLQHASSWLDAQQLILSLLWDKINAPEDGGGARPQGEDWDNEQPNYQH